MPEITGIEKQKRGGGVDILVDGELWLSVHRDVIYECAVRRGDLVTPDLLVRLQAAEANHSAYEAALSLLSYRPRAEGELRQRLQRKGFAVAAVEAALDRLRHSGLVNDEQFARSWVESRGGGAAGRGRPLLTAELRAKGVAADVIAGAVQETDEHGSALAVARQRAARLRGLDYAEFRRRLGSFLQRRGFNYEATNAAVRTLWQERDVGAVDNDDAD